MSWADLEFIMEFVRLEKPSKILSATTDLAPLCSPLNLISKCHIHMFLEWFQGSWLHDFPGYSVPLFVHPFS